MKDPSAPKRPLTSFFLFARKERPRLIAELGNISVVEVGKELGRRWSRLDMAFKEKYDIAHIEAKSRYLDEMKNYKPSMQFLEKKAKQDKILQLEESIQKKAELVEQLDMAYSSLQDCSCCQN